MTTDAKSAPPPFSIDAFPLGARAMALGAGDLHQAVRRHVTTLLSDKRNTVAEMAQKALQEIVDRKVITAAEGAQLGGIFKTLLAVDRGKEDPEDAYLKIRNTYHDMALKLDVSPAALTIASIAVSAFSLEKNSPLKVNWTAGGVGAVTGAAVGAGIGFGIADVPGAIIGGIIGGIVGGTVGLCGSGET